MVRLVITICFVLWLPAAWAASFSAQVDKQQLTTEESVTLTLQLINSESRLRAEGVNPTIDLSVLNRDFTLGVPKTEFRYNLYQGSGRSTSELKVELFPKRSGDLKIPSFTLDDLRTQAIMLNVKPLAADAAPEAFVRAHLANQALWVNQQLIVYLDVYHRVALEGASLGSVLETEPQRIELLPNWELPRKSFKQRHKGFDYDVERLAWAIFPTQSGNFAVRTPIVELVKAGSKPQLLPSQRLEVSIKALPPGIPSNIIIGKPQLDASVLPASAKQNEAISWNLTLSAPVAVSSLPDYLPLPEFPAALKLYPDRAHHDNTKTNDGITDRALYTLSIMPLEAGDFIIPEIQVPYFDPERGVVDSINLPRRSISISASTLPSATSVTGDNASAQPTIEKQTAITAVLPWQIATGIMTLLWLMTLAFGLNLWRKHKIATTPASTPTQTSSEIKRRTNEHPLQTQLLAAFGSRTLEQGLMQWLKEAPEDREALEVVRAVQRLCYGHTTNPDYAADSSLTERVAQLCGRIKQFERHPKTTLDPWSPEAFTASPHKQS